MFDVLTILCRHFTAIYCISGTTINYDRNLMNLRRVFLEVGGTKHAVAAETISKRRGAGRGPTSNRLFDCRCTFYFADGWSHIGPGSRFLADRSPTQYMIGYWQHPVVRPSVCLSVCLSVTLSIVALGVVYRAKSCISVFVVGKFLFVPSDTYALGCII